MNSGVYKITNVETGKFYIGSTNDVDKRWSDHKRDLNNGNHINPKLQHSWNFYGESKFEFHLIEEVNPNEKLLLEREQYYLDTFKPYMRGVGYNICPTSCGGDNFTHNPRKEEIRKYMSSIWSGESNPMFGRSHKKSSIKLQKDKSIGRYTLDWFTKKYGVVEGEKKYQERKLMLSNRPPIRNKRFCGAGFAGQKHGKDLRSKQNKTKNYFKHHWEEFTKMVLSGKYTLRDISSITGISRQTINLKAKAIKKLPPEGGSSVNLTSS
jgi:group I intron endonuclease